MTVVAWDGKTLAADKAAHNVGYLRTVTKIFRVPGGLVGFSGNGDRALEMLAWFRAGRDAATYPAFQRDGDKTVDCLFVGLDGVQLTYGETPHPQRCEDGFNATGHGRDYALAAMYLGFDARRAVEVACALDCNCGNGIDTLTLEATDVCTSDQAGRVQLLEEAPLQ